ncbi:PQQ-binding-like beta-propeller repeat protein, partial [bacterium]|nr:PQQ-binding-like beta-propeller repeat protein [bacterium]
VLDRIENGIDEIFHFDPLELPIEIETAETLWVDFWFTPHTGITYLDTLEIFTNEMRRRVELFLRGTGSDSVYGEGSVMWYHRLVEAEGEIGSIARIDDINEDGTDELVAVGPDGSIYCLNGFASDAADVLWVQDFGNQPYSPVNLKPSGVISGEGDLNEDGYRDIVIGSGAEDRSVYGISGIDGEQLWRWDSRSLDIEGGVQELINTDDMNGDGAFDPLVLINRDEEGSTSIVRLNGSTGRLVWVRNIEEATDIESLDDFDRDGAMDFIVSSANFIYLYGGSDGSLLARFEEPASAPVIAVSDLNQDNMDDLIYLTSEGNLTAKSIQDGEDIWSINSIGNFQLRLPLRFLINLENDVNGNDVNDIAGIDATGALFIVDPVLGDSILINQLADVTSFTVIPDINNDAKPELIIGHQNGRITCISSVDGSEIWIIEDQLIIERVVQIIPFEDVDLSGFNDIVGIFDDGIVRAISTGGELTIDKPELLTPSMHVISEISPNPFNGTVQISIDLPINSPLKLNIWDVNGRSIQVYNYGFLNSGNHKFSLNLAGERNLANGIYLFRFEGSFGHFTERVLFLK